MRPALNATRSILGKTFGTDTKIVGAEVGVLRGENAREILREWEQVGVLYAIDTYANSDKAYNIALENLRGLEARFEWIIEDSVSAAATLPELHFAYIDGDHSYEGVKRDIAAYWPRIMKGGVLCGHDYQFRWTSVAGVVKAVDEFAVQIDAKNGFNFFTQYSGSSSDWWFIKGDIA